MRYVIGGAALLAVVLFCVGKANAIDPECVTTPDPPVVAIDGSDSMFEYCSPATTDDGQPLPATDYPMDCMVEENGVVIHTAPNLGPGAHVVVTLPALRFKHDLTLLCSNSAGRGEVLGPVPGTFPASPPGRPRILQGK